MLMRVVSSTWLPSCCHPTTLNTENSMKSTPTGTAYSRVCRDSVTKGAYRLSICRAVSGVFEYNESRTAFCGASWKPQQPLRNAVTVRHFPRAGGLCQRGRQRDPKLRGIQGGEFFRRHPADIQFVEYFGETLFLPTHATRTWRWAIC